MIQKGPHSRDPTGTNYFEMKFLLRRGPAYNLPRLPRIPYNHGVPLTEPDRRTRRVYQSSDKRDQVSGPTARLAAPSARQGSAL